MAVRHNAAPTNGTGVFLSWKEWHKLECLTDACGMAVLDGHVKVMPDKPCVTDL